MNDDNRPNIVLVVPYYDYVDFLALKLFLKFLVGVSIVSNVFFLNLGLFMYIVPKPIVDHMMGKTTEQVKIEARNAAISDRYERFEKQEKIRKEAIFKDKQKKVLAESAKKSRLELDKIINNPVVSEETARLRAFH